MTLRVTCHIQHRVTCPALSHCIPCLAVTCHAVSSAHVAATWGQAAGGAGRKQSESQYSAARPLAPACPPVLYAQLHNRNQHLSAILPTPSVCRFITITISLTPSVSRFPRSQVSSEPQPPVPAPAAEEETLGGVPAQLPQRHQHPGWVDITSVDISSVNISSVDISSVDTKISTIYLPRVGEAGQRDGGPAGGAQGGARQGDQPHPQQGGECSEQ